MLQAMARVTDPERMTRARSSLHASSALGPSQDSTRAPAKPCYVKRLPNEVLRRILYYVSSIQLFFSPKLLLTGF